jgi:hypothetical protein
MKLLYILVFLFGCNNISVAGVLAHTQISEEINLGYPSLQKVVRFKIDKAYEPEIHETFFRIFVDYPSMHPTLGPRKFKLNENTLEILVQAHPKYGTGADRLMAGEWSASELASENGFRVFTKKIGKTGQTKIFGYKNGSDNVIVSDPGAWSVRYSMTRGVSDVYQFKCHFSKTLGVPFKDIDNAVFKLLSTMRTE